MNTSRGLIIEQTSRKSIPRQVLSRLAAVRRNRGEGSNDLHSRSRIIEAFQERGSPNMRSLVLVEQSIEGLASSRYRCEVDRLGEDEDLLGHFKG